MKSARRSRSSAAEKKRPIMAADSSDSPERRQACRPKYLKMTLMSAGRAWVLPVQPRAPSLRRLQSDAVAGVDALDRAVGAQPVERGVDRLPQLVIGAHHADGDVPGEVGLAV